MPKEIRGGARLPDRILGASGTKSWRLAATVGVLLFALGGSGPGEAYRFLAVDGGPWGVEDRTAIVPVDQAVRWSAAVWGPGETLIFEVAPDPDFEVLFDSPEGVIPYFERALAAWSEIPTADIKLRVDGVAENDRILPKLFANPEDGGHSGARRWDSFRSGKWERFSCDIGLSSYYASLPDDVDPEELDNVREERRERAVAYLVHEIGHCIGLENAGALSSTHRWVWDPPDWVQIHPRDPAMSGGRDRHAPDELSADDVAGASLLRPAPGFRATTGTVFGTLDLGGEPAPYVQVWALPLKRDPLRDRVGVMSDHEGVFRIEGLEPGAYALWAQPLHPSWYHWWLLQEDPPLDLDETIWGRPVWVYAGRKIGPITIPLRQGRVPRPRPDRVVARQETGPPVSIIESWASPCAGVRVRAEEQPFLADGPDARPERWIGDARWYATTLTLEWARGSEKVVFDWAGPYRNWYWDYWAEEEGWEFFPSWRDSELDVNISDWRIKRSGSGGAIHTAEIAWPEFAEVRLRFRSDDGACDGEPMVVCTTADCGLSPGAVAVE